MNLVVEALGGDLAHAVAEETARHAEAIRIYREARDSFVESCYLEEELEATRARLKAYIIEQEMGPPNSLSYTAAEKKVATHPDYVEHQKRQRDTVKVKENFRTHSTVALHSADLALARMKALAGLR